jgi:hypothetical protein
MERFVALASRAREIKNRSNLDKDVFVVANMIEFAGPQHRAATSGRALTFCKTGHFEPPILWSQANHQRSHAECLANPDLNLRKAQT